MAKPTNGKAARPALAKGKPMPLVLPRRKFLLGLAAGIVAPAIVKFDSLMPVKVMETDSQTLVRVWSYFWRLNPRCGGGFDVVAPDGSAFPSSGDSGQDYQLIVAAGLGRVVGEVTYREVA